MIQGGAAGQIIMFATADGGCLPALYALVGKYDLLVDANGTVFPDHNRTINMRIEVSGNFAFFEAIAHPSSTSIVAGVRRMGCTGERHVS